MKFIEKNLKLILIILLLGFFMQLCTIKTKIKDVEERVILIDSLNNSLRRKLDDLSENNYPKDALDIRIQIEGLKSEKRMIQATNRKMLDVERQNAIEKEIKVLEEKLNNED